MIRSRSSEIGGKEREGGAISGKYIVAGALVRVMWKGRSSGVIAEDEDASPARVKVIDKPKSLDPGRPAPIIRYIHQERLFRCGYLCRQSSDTSSAH